MKTRNTIIAMALATLSINAFAAGEQVFEATINNNQQTCSIDYAPGSHQQGTLLLKNDTSSSASGIAFDLKTNVKGLAWRITEAKVTAGKEGLDITDSEADNLLSLATKDKTSIIVNDVDYSWQQAADAKNVVGRQAHLTVAPKVNKERQDLSYGDTTIQGKITAVCGL